ncbi:hypothetical protein AGMMS49975_10720 [Clostridia bacterium]|nr:hypothetical protein AGMMS49975_10720 [Clostridia bacterium]
MTRLEYISIIKSLKTVLTLGTKDDAIEILDFVLKEAGAFSEQHKEE